VSSDFALRTRAGMTLVEALLAMGGTVFLAACMVAMLGTHARLARYAAERAEALDAVHTSVLLLASELRAARPDTDVAVSTDSLALRAFRGIARVCALSANVADVLWSGLRDPDPAKDSLLALSAAGEHALPLIGLVTAAANACPSVTGAKAFRLTTDTLPPGTSMLLGFERGSYHLGTALRYRAGRAGRQPLTADIFTAKSGFTAESTAVLVDLVPASVPWKGGPPSAAPVRRRITFLHRRSRQ